MEMGITKSCSNKEAVGKGSCLERAARPNESRPKKAVDCLQKSKFDKNLLEGRT
jgi:hypothetical protein